MTEPGDPIDPTRVSATSMTGQEASQGRKGAGVIRILAISLVLVVVVLFGLYALHAKDLSSNHGAGGQSGTINHTEVDSFHTAPPSPKQAPAGVPESRGASAGDTTTN